MISIYEICSVSCFFKNNKSNLNIYLGESFGIKLKNLNGIQMIYVLIPTRT